MSLSNSRNQFLAFESHNQENIQYERKGGIFVSTCVCVSFIICAVLVSALVGVIVYFITYFKLSQPLSTNEIWNEAEPFGHNGPPSPDLRLPSDVVPSFYRLKLRTDLDNSSFKGEVYITVKAKSNIKEIILHSKGLSINSNAKLTEQTYEEIPTLHRQKREEPSNDTATADNTTTITNSPVDPTEKLSNVTEKPTENKTVEVLNIEHNGTVKLNTNKSASPDETVNDAPSTVAHSTEPTSDVPISNDTVYTTVPSETHVTHSTVRNIRIVSITHGSGDRLVIKLATALKPDVDYILELNFEGKISDAMTGFYKSTYSSDGQVKSLGVTQFEPTSARAAFPCFDEPAYKAMFEISIAHPTNLTALSNMKVSAQEDIPESPGWRWTHFERSVNMSTYLVAYVVSDFRSVETAYVGKDNITKPIRVWTRPELINKADYALTITPKLLQFYEGVFGLPYALDKIDLVAIPDFSSGAMENWGLVTFRETTLLFDAKASTPRDKQNVAIDVAHELAHQWFGNLVTMRWWTDLWLNEGFATYIEYVGVDHIEPEWNMFESFSIDKMDLLRSDSLKNTSPVSRKVIDASEISQKFDEISYTKGANLIRMLNHTVSEELFHKGLLIYLNDWKYANAEENDLWTAMSSATASEPNLGHLSVVQFMNSWTRQAGYPVLNVERNYESGDVMFEQKLFTSSEDPYQSMLDQIWHIPVSYMAVGADGAKSTKPKLWLKERSVTAKVPVNATQALYVNVDAIGYYRVNYDKKNWELLSTALKSGYFKSPITKAQLIDDAFNLAKFSHLNYSQALGLTTCVIEGEDSKVVWDLLLNNMGFLKYNIKTTSGYMYFQDYLKILLQKQLERLNFGLSKPKDDNEAFLIENLVMWECEVEAPRCLKWAQDEFANWSKQDDLSNNTIPTYLRSLVYNMAIRHGGRPAFEFFWNAFQNATDPNVRTIIINNLPSTREPALITLLLERSLNEIPNQYASAVWGVEPTFGTPIAQDFLIKNFDAIYNKFTSMDDFTFPSILSGAFGFITTDDELNKLKSFAAQHKEKLLPMSQTLQKMMDTARLRIEWVRRHARTVNDWLRDYVTKHKNSVSETTSTAAPVPTTTGTVNGTEIGTVNATETGTVNATETGTVNATETGTVNATETGTVNATETGIGNDITGNVVQNGTDATPDNSTSTTPSPEKVV